MIAAIQTFGSDIDWHPHLHCLVTNGAFTSNGTYHAMEILSPSVIMEIFQSPIEAFEDRHKVFRMLLKEGYYGWYSNKSRGLSPIIRNSADRRGQD